MIFQKEHTLAALRAHKKFLQDLFWSQKLKYLFQPCLIKPYVFEFILRNSFLIHHNFCNREWEKESLDQDGNLKPNANLLKVFWRCFGWQYVALGILVVFSVSGSSDFDISSVSVFAEVNDELQFLQTALLRYHDNVQKFRSNQTILYRLRHF